MGKLGVRLNSRKNAKRWPKGQSSSSNPQTVTHREQASWMFFKDPIATEKPGITKEDLEKHDACQGVKSPAETSENDNNSWESCTEYTSNTFATNYSNCSNVSFSRFLNNFQSNSLLHKEMLAVLSAVTEIIKQNGGNETSTEYFAAMMSTLEAIESNMSIAATLSLLGMGLKTVPKNVLNVQFGAASKIFLDILVKYTSSEEYLILRHCIHCLSLLLRAQEAATWSNSSTMQVLDVILSFTIHYKPKLRKSAQHGIIAILNGSDIMKSEDPPPYHPAAPYIAIFCIDLLEPDSESNGITNILHVLTLLKDIFHHIPKTYVKIISESLLKLMTMKNVLITSCCLQAFHVLFVSRPPELILPVQRNGQIISALYVYQPPATDIQPTLAWLTVMQEAHLTVAHNSLNLCAALLPRMFETCIKYWLSDKSEIISGTSHTLKILLQDCVGKFCETEETIKTYKDAIDQITLIMREALHYRYLEAWYYIFHLIALLFEITGKAKSPQLIEILKNLAVLRDCYNFTLKNDAEYAIGAAIKFLGPETVLNLIPLKPSKNIINLKRSWLLPLLKNCLLGGSLTFFMQTLLPIATLCEKKSFESIGGKTYEFLGCQIWAILPSICNDATDVKDNFKNIAKLLGTNFSNKNLRMSILHSLRRLITRAVENNKEEDICELARFAKNYLPLFLSLYTTKPNGTDEEGQRSSTYNTIKIYLTITNKELVNELFDRVLSKLKEPHVDDFLKESIHDIIRLLIEHTDIDKIKAFYDISVSCLKENSKLREQKKVYRFLEEICGSEKETCKAFVAQYRREIQKLLISSATEVAKPSRGSRLRCLIHLVKIHPQLEKTKFLEAVVPEAVIYLKDLNAHCRNSAYKLLNTIAEKFLGHPTHLKDYVNMLMIGLSGGEQNIQKYCIASLLALSSITYYYNGSLDMDTIKEILEHACVFVTSPTREITEAALAYIKVYITAMPYHIVAPNLKMLIDALCGMSNDCQRHFRQKIRDILVKLIRKYGMETISSMIPASNVILHKRLKNMNKVEMKKKKKRELKKLQEEENKDDIEFDAKRKPKSLEEILADSDNEFEENLENEKPTKKKRTSRKEAWIQENEEIIDLIDPAAARNISTTQPGVINSKTTAAKRKDREFKTAPDGRLIITLDNEKADEPKPKRKKKSTILLHSDSEDDYEDDDIQSVKSQEMGRKRKHSDNYDNLSVKSASTTKYEAGGSGIHRSLKKAKIERIPGAEYKALKAGGDVKKKGKPDPYAYVPLTRAALNRSFDFRKNKKNASKFHNIIKGAKKGAKIGIKKRKN
ncbi:unnamed protein product [Heterotrigona itama]|uniref:Uncharacterized protein n=1 Tax=Heterotrigona itama TaxID=395501 RepID=A0A6V7H147_9HYME|nr:unnamed protein product [Heterotrigona itama]